MLFKKNQLKLTFLNGTSWLKSYKYAKNLKILDLNSIYGLIQLSNLYHVYINILLS
jgi:hypothetical protein